MRRRLFFIGGGKVVTVVLWGALIAASLGWNLQVVDDNMTGVAMSVGRAFFEEIQTTRLWNARHGGVYVPITETTQPNPYLKGEDRDVVTTGGLRLTKINPAFMTRQIAELAKEQSGVQYHITSLRPVRPENAADAWETQVLQGFATGRYREFFEFIADAGHYRYMGVLPIQESCLTCHSRGYRLGDVRGGISVTIPAQPYLASAGRARVHLWVMHLLVWGAGSLLFYLFRRFREQQMRLLDEKNRALSLERDAAEQARQEATAAHAQITDSILYAKNIQSSLLPDRALFCDRLPESFVIWMPKDWVGGDLLFADLTETPWLLVVADCTGHGVPGALMTMLVASGLRSLVPGMDRRDPAALLAATSRFVKTALRQDTPEAGSDDGLDMAVCSLDSSARRLVFAGARLPLLYVHQQAFRTIPGDRQSLGYKSSDVHFAFTNHILEMEEEDVYWLATDGISSQLGGPQGFPFGSSRLRDLLSGVVQQPMAVQRETLLSVLQAYQGERQQVDDITVVGFKCPSNGMAPLLVDPV
ncbi:MAG: DUF3365 domain-containing protein [Magnetococcales bacterium]|nr:DUF3365 domain-containing protein [Magnetococcales bacterium]